MPELDPLTVDDCSEMAAIERAVTPFPWSETLYKEAIGGSEYGWAIRSDGGIQGFIVFQQVLDEATLQNIVVAKDQQGCGVGRSLLLAGLRQLTQRGVDRCFLEVRRSNHNAIQLYRSLGFRLTGERKGYYPSAGDREDALLMMRELPLIEKG